MPAEAGVPLGALAALVGGRVVGDPAVRIAEVTHDSRLATEGSLFVAIPGFRQDGHDFLEAAAGRGARAVCVERASVVPIPQLVVGAGRRALPLLAAEVYGHPSRRLAVVGVTGTNGKTTVTHMLEAIAEAAGLPSGLVGTVGGRVAGRPVHLARTTPEAGDFQRLLGAMVADGVRLAAVEVSSHALALHRVDATWFEVAAFTNLSQDHLDFHGDLETYYQAKAGLFRPERAGRAVIWIDDPAGRRLIDAAAMPVTTVGLSEGAEVGAEDLECGIGESVFVLRLPEGRRKLRVPIGGEFNVANALVAVACARAVGLPLEAIASGLEGMAKVPGRFESVEAGQDFAVVVDYAHTPQGVAYVVEAARRLVGGRVIVVVGAGGDRDRLKRPLMGRAAGRAELVVVTSDNPRSEDPSAIVREVADGARESEAGVLEEPDRRLAIRAAVRMAAPGDIVLILGKGHEQGQEVGAGLVPFDDRQVAREELEAR
ncbi:MAG: UDP-N-acetylmuramoyl-L-alanyl-D-glutamate--2,6-diaminopimelate ligase [Acidimicrobiia bacterium]